MKRISVLGLGLLALLFSFSFVQAQDDGKERLRAEIRMSLLQDPRAAALPEGELGAMVEVLAGEVETQRVTYDFILPPISFVEEIASYFTPWGQQISQATLYGVILVCLGLALLLLKKMVSMHRSKGLAVNGGMV